MNQKSEENSCDAFFSGHAKQQGSGAVKGYSLEISEAERLSQVIRGLAQPVQPIPTGVTPQLKWLGNVKAVMWDVYGTLLVSGTGDVGSAATMTQAEAVQAAVDALGGRLKCSAEEAADVLLETIRETNAHAKVSGVDVPEVEIQSIWRRLADQLGFESLQGWNESPDRVVRQLAIEYEMRANPTWAMPGAVSTLRRVKQLGLRQGIVSNAQYYTPLILEVLLGVNHDDAGFQRIDNAGQAKVGIVSRVGSQPVEAAEAEDRLEPLGLSGLGFSENDCHYSYIRKIAKPAQQLFQAAAEGLARTGIDAEDVLYVGNDMLNDVWGARQVGFQTALFAGDGRSLRMRESDPRVQQVRPDIILTELSQLLDCLTNEPR